MNIGDKVRFLNAVGGGTITAFQGKDLVLVCDADGFEIPTLRSEIVVIDTNDYNFARSSSTPSKEISTTMSDEAPPTSIKAMLSRHASAVRFGDEEEATTVGDSEVDIADMELRFRARPVERRGGDKLNLYLGFLPMDSRTLSKTSFEAFLVNDSNYELRYAIFSQQGTAYSLLAEGAIEANTKIFLDEYTHDDLPELERLTFQIFAFKRGKSFELKQPANLTLRIDGTKFYKLHTFQPSDFFDVPALVHEILREDRPAQQVEISPIALQEAIVAPKDARRVAAPARNDGSRFLGSKGTDRNAILEVDLHASEILDSTAGMENRDILMCQMRVFHDTMRAHSKDVGRRIVFIHGKGDGVLRSEILKDLKRHYRQCTHQDASFREYGFGATMVTIK